MRKTTIVGVGIAAVALCLAAGAWSGHRARLSTAPRAATAGAVAEAAAPATDPMPRHAFGPASARHAAGEFHEAATTATSSGQPRGPADTENATASVDQDVAGADGPGPDSAAFARLGDPLALLRDRLADSNPERRIAAVHDVAPVGEGAVALQQILREDRDPRVRASAAVQLGDGSGFAVIRSLLAALDDADPDVVQQSLGALASIGDASVIPDLTTKQRAQKDAPTAARFDEAISELGAHQRRMPARPVFAEEAQELAPRDEFADAYADSPGSDVATATSRQPR